ncbi:MAG TPA: UdgX family uracil-DNA binding protein [Candidatus Binataceae bacterium]|nr:UdgX family uracil-DNA binding protein [Candidatus Binataceae bacterium]
MTTEESEPLPRRAWAGREEEGGLTGARTLVALGELREAVNGCRRCTLWKATTQGVPGEGAVPARLMLVGEAPGDSEDLQGHPFIGPAGAILDRALKDAGLGRDSVYITNAVKHFKFEPRGKRRLHIKPSAGEIEACHWWLGEELRLVAPKLVMALGGTAARALLGHPVIVSQLRGAPIRLSATAHLWVTVHPSFLLRIPDEAQRRTEYARFVRELQEAVSWIEKH